MMQKLLGVLAAGVVAACSAAASGQTVITRWSFNSPTADNNINTGTISPSIGAGTATAFGGTTTSFAGGAVTGGSSDPEIDDNSAWQTTAYPAQGTGSRTAGVRFAVSTCGFNGIVVQWDTRHSNTSSGWQRVQYTLNVSAATPVWVDGPLFEASLGGDRWYNARTLDLSSVSGANDNVNFAVRMISEFAPGGSTYAASTTTSTYAGTGTWRFDWVTVSGNSLGGCGRPQVGSVGITPSAVCAGETITITAPVTPGTNPASTGLQVRANLTAVGGPASQALFDDGSNGDAVAGDGVYSLSWTIPLGTAPGLNVVVPVTVSDAQSRSSTSQATLNLSNCTGQGQVVISQVYGGGGNTGAVYNYDFIELFNRGGTPVNITGWAVHYAAANGNFLTFTQLSGTIQPGGYYLIRQDGNAAVGQPLPQPWDAIGIIGMANTAGRVALTTKALPLTDCFDATISDLVTYGSTATFCYEGNGPTPAPDNQNAVLRSNNGCVDTNDNAADCYRGTPTPRNSASAPFICSGTAPTGAGSFTPSAQCAGSLVTFEVTVTPGTGPASTGVQVTADLTSLGGTANTNMTPVGGDVYRTSLVIPASLAPGGRTVYFVVRDAQNRVTGAASSVIVQRCSNLASGISDPAAVCSDSCGSLRFVVFVTPADTPAPGALTVTADLSAIGGPSAQTFYDDGTNGDATAFDNVFSFAATYSAGLTPGSLAIPFTVSDDLGRVTNGTVTVPVYAGCTQADSTVVISQVYGGGGNVGSFYRSDFVELKNPAQVPVSVDGWSVQYASRTGTFTQKVDLAGTIQPGGFYLVELSRATAGADLPTADATGTIGIDNGDGKLALVSSTTLLGSACTGASVVDLVGYGSQASCFEGGGPTVSPSNTLAVIRRNDGCQDTNRNDADFINTLPNPRNRFADPASCQPVVCAQPCAADYNRDAFLNLDDLGDFITDFYTVPAIPGGVQANAPTYSETAIGYGVPCEFAGNAPAPYASNAYRAFGYRVGYSSDGSNSCPLDPSQPFPNLDNLNDYITFYYGSFGTEACSN